MGADDLWNEAQANAVAARTSFCTCPKCHTTHIGGKKKFNREHGVGKCTLIARQDAAEAMDVDPDGLQLVADGAGHGHTGACHFRSVCSSPSLYSLSDTLVPASSDLQMLQSVTSLRQLEAQWPHGALGAGRLPAARGAQLAEAGTCPAATR